MKPVTIVCISGTHELHRELDVPNGDILIHAGDFTMFSKSAAAILDFNEWLRELPHRWKILTPGNHEFFLESDPSRRRLISNATVLINEGGQVAGLVRAPRTIVPKEQPMESSQSAQNGREYRVPIIGDLPERLGGGLGREPRFEVGFLERTELNAVVDPLDGLCERCAGCGDLVGGE
jgi:hypothetical protein